MHQKTTPFHPQKTPQKRAFRGMVSIRSATDYSPFGVQLENRNFLKTGSVEYSRGFNGMIEDDQIKGDGNSYNFGARMLDPRLGRFLSIDKECQALTSHSPYNYALNTPIQAGDEDGNFPIFINGKTTSDNYRASPTYWDQSHFKAFKRQYGYEIGELFKGSNSVHSKFSGDFLFVDGNKGLAGAWMAHDRQNEGSLTAKCDAQMIWDKLKESVNEDGKITEKIQILSHSRGSAFANGYVETLKDELIELSKKDGIGFAYDEGLVVDLVIHLAPHQSNEIDVEQSKTTTVTVSHVGDYLSDMDVTGDVVNIETTQGWSGSKDVLQYSHRNGTFKGEVGKLLYRHTKNQSEGKRKYYGLNGLLNQQTNISKGDKANDN